MSMVEVSFDFDDMARGNYVLVLGKIEHNGAGDKTLILSFADTEDGGRTSVAVLKHEVIAMCFNKPETRR